MPRTQVRVCAPEPLLDYTGDTQTLEHRYRVQTRKLVEKPVNHDRTTTSEDRTPGRKEVGCGHDTANHKNETTYDPGELAALQRRATVLM